MASLFSNEDGVDLDCTPVKPPPVEDVINVRITNPTDFPGGGGGSENGTGVSSVNGVASVDGSIILGSDDIPEGTVNKYATTVNIDAAGATMNSDSNISGNTWVLDEDGMASNSNTKLATQQSIKAYVDSSTNGDFVDVSSVTAITIAFPDNADVLLVTSSDGISTVTIPLASVSTNRRITIKRAAGANNVIIAASGTDTIDGVGSKTLTAQGKSFTLVSDGSNWYIIGSH